MSIKYQSYLSHMADILAAGWHYLATDWLVSAYSSHVPAMSQPIHRDQVGALARQWRCPHIIYSPRMDSIKLYSQYTILGSSYHGYGKEMQMLLLLSKVWTGLHLVGQEDNFFWFLELSFLMLKGRSNSCWVTLGCNFCLPWALKWFGLFANHILFRHKQSCVLIGS